MKEVLIVEKDDIIAHVLEGMLTRSDYVITGKVTTGEEAIALVAEHTPDLVIIDVALSGKLDSIATAFYVNHIFNIPVIFISEKTDEETLRRVLSAEPYGFITIPFNNPSIVTNVALAISNHETRKRLTGVEDRFSQNLMSLLDGVILTDVHGRVLLLNPYAERLIEISRAQAVMKPLNKMLILVDTRSGERIDDPVRTIIRESMVIGLENYIAIISLNGKRREIALKAQPVTDSRNEVIGAFVRIHEKSHNEKKMQRQSN